MIPVLVVDDSLTVRMDLEEALAAAGFAPTGCATLGEARAALAERRFALVVLDVLLPDGDGVELVAELKRRPDAPPVMLLSSEAEVKDRIRGLERGADAYVGKPYDAGALVARARELVRRDGRADAGGREGHGPVLVVDDSVTVREALRGDLEAAGIEVVTAASGAEALRLAADRLPAAVVVDGRMPGMDGATFIRHLRDDAVLRTTPCILLTGSESVGEVGALDAGADAYVRKEEGHQVVLARLQALLRASTPAAAWTAGMLSPKRIVAIAPPGASRDAVAAALRADGHEVVPAPGVEAAVALAAVDLVDALVLRAPDRDAAVRACERIRAAPALHHVPLLLVTDGDDHALALRALNAGADDCVVLQADLLRARVRAQLRRKQFEDENRLREAYARNAAILETISDAFFATDRAWRIVYANHAFEELVGAAREDLVGAPLWGGPAARLAALEPELREAAEAGAPRTFEAPLGDDRWLEVRAFPHPDGVSAHLRDVSDRRRSQEVQAHLLGIVGHDLRTPLTSIRISAAGMTRDAELDDRQRRAIERIEGGAARMTRLISTLLDYSRARLGQGLPMEPRPADLEEICAEVLDAVREANPGRAIVYEHEGDGAGEWDPERIHQVLVNLLTNALRHGASDTPVTLAWRGRRDEKVIAIHNEGAPIDPRLLSHMFEPFTRAEPGGPTWGGVGLGLYIVKQIVVAHGGAVRVRSEAGAGTTFEVRLPRSPPVR